MKLTNIQLANLTRLAKDEACVTAKARHDSDEVYIAKCWMAALEKLLKMEGLKYEHTP